MENNKHTHTMVIPRRCHTDTHNGQTGKEEVISIEDWVVSRSRELTLVLGEP